LADFYAKSVAVDGLLVLGSERVADAALLEASYLTNQMLSGAPQVRKALADVGLRITVMAADEFTTDVPEHRDLKPKEYWNRRARG
jgi:hypothetical protein